MIRVLNYGMSPNLGGIEIFIMNNYRKIDRNKIQFDFLTFCDEIAFQDEILRLGGNIHRLTSRKENVLKNYLELKNFFKVHDEYDIIHYHINTCSYILPLKMVQGNLKYTIIVHSHNEWKGNSIVTNFFHRINRSKIRKISNYRFACSEIAGKYMFGDNIDLDKNFRICPNSIDTKEFIFCSEKREEKRKELDLENEFVIGHVGRLSYQKNHEFILDIFNEVHKRNKDSRLVLAGDGELRSQIIAKVKNLQLEGVVHILGLRNDVDELMNAFDVFLLPSHFEGFGIVALEAQASGIRTIVSDVVPKDIEITDLVEFVSLKNDAPYWANIVLKYQNGYERKNMFRIISKSNYDISKNVRWLEDFYLLNSSSKCNS